ncbi:MAG: hypothetical protein MI919_29790, partial [Holophagales bacterium]|nr:hypothetical protein [Holophagales bacterium]
LLHRLAGYSIRLPTLAERRDDVGRLLVYFLEQELGRPLETDLERPWPPAEIVARLARYDWPGNVRELRNVARWLVIAGRGCAPGELAARLEEVLAENAQPEPDTRPAPRRTSPASADPQAPLERRRLRKPEEVGEDELRTTLAAHRWEPAATAEALGVSRATLYRMIDETPSIRKAAELGREEIEAALERSGGKLDATAAELEVSLRGLKRRLTVLGLDRP